MVLSNRHLYLHVRRQETHPLTGPTRKSVEVDDANDIFYKTNGSTEWFNTSLKKIYSTIGSALRWYKQKPVALPKGMIRDNISGRIIKKAYLTTDQIEKIEETNNVNI